MPHDSTQSLYIIILIDCYFCLQMVEDLTFHSTLVQSEQLKFKSEGLDVEMFFLTSQQHLVSYSAFQGMQSSSKQLL